MGSVTKYLTPYSTLLVGVLIGVFVYPKVRAMIGG
jgi:hypothetical protein